MSNDIIKAKKQCRGGMNDLFIDKNDIVDGVLELGDGIIGQIFVISYPSLKKSSYSRRCYM